MYTDVVDVSIQRERPGTNEGHLKIFISVVKIKRSYFILAAHPMFIFDENIDKWSKLRIDERNESRVLPENRKYDHLHGPVNNRVDPSDYKKSIGNLPELWRGGCFLEESYATTAYFMVVKKLLKKFKNVHVYTDAAPLLAKYAGVVFADEIKNDMVEVGVFRHLKAKEARAYGHYISENTRYHKGTGAVRRKIIRREIKRIDNKINEMEKSKLGELYDSVDENLLRDTKAKLLRKNVRGAYSDAEGWRWFVGCHTTNQYKAPRILWHTRRDNVDEDVIVDFIKNATQQPVDSAIASLRQSVSGLSRPELRADMQRSYRNTYRKPANIIAEMQIVMFIKNYCRRPTNRNKSMPLLEILGISAVGDRREDIGRIFRHSVGFAYAARVTKWNGS